MSNFWGSFSKPFTFPYPNPNGSSSPPHHKLQDGLFQIASQTCSLLVQVNNTNNISYGDNAVNVHNTSFVRSPSGFSSASTGTNQASGSNDVALQITDVSANQINQNKPSTSEQLVMLLPTTEKTIKNGFVSNISSRYRHRLSTVLEHSPTNEDADLWQHGYMFRGDDDIPSGRWKNAGWCKPSCIPISIILVLIFLVVLLPLLDHAIEEDHRYLNAEMRKFYSTCPNKCKLQLVESIPEGLNYSSAVKFPSIFDSWVDLIASAESTIEIASMYWTLRKSEVYPHPSSQDGEFVYQKLLEAGVERKIKIKIAQNIPTEKDPNIDTEYLVKRKAAEVRSLNFAKLLGGGVLHTKFWIVDGKHFFVGSANMDWRSLTQVKELGVIAKDCACLAEDLRKIFEVYWILGEEGAKIPAKWPNSLSTDINLSSPMNVTYNNQTQFTYLSSSPELFNPTGRTNDIVAILNTIESAEQYVHISVMDYIPAQIYTARKKFWPTIDDALRAAAINNRVTVRLLIGQWNHTRDSQWGFLRSLKALDKVYPWVNIQVKIFQVPASPDQSKIPYARVAHNKYMVTDLTAYIGTSNWAGDYFIDTAGVGVILNYSDNNHIGDATLRDQLQAIFMRDWQSEYAHDLI